MPKSVNKVILVGNVGKFLCPGLAPTKGSKIAAVSGRTGRSGTTSWLGSVWQRSLGSTLPEGPNSTSRESQTSIRQDRQSGEKKDRTEIVARDSLLLGPRPSRRADLYPPPAKPEISPTMPSATGESIFDQ